jgi:hypothetical protein
LDVLDACQAAALASAGATSDDAMVVALAGMTDSAAQLNEHAARNLLRGHSTEPSQWRRARRIQRPELQVAVRSISPELTAAIAAQGWGSFNVAAEIAAATI